MIPIHLTNDSVTRVAQAPTTIEALTGQKVSDLMSYTPVMSGGIQDGPGVNGQHGATVEANAQNEDKIR